MDAQDPFVHDYSPQCRRAASPGGAMTRAGCRSCQPDVEQLVQPRAFLWQLNEDGHLALHPLKRRIDRSG